MTERKIVLTRELTKENSDYINSIILCPCGCGDKRGVDCVYDTIGERMAKNKINGILNPQSWIDALAQSGYTV